MATKANTTRSTDAGGTAGATKASRPTVDAHDPVVLDPTEAELDEWAAQERARREAWLRGPTPEERAAFAQRERDRRLAHLEGGDDALWADPVRLMRRYPREAQLAAEGAMSLAWKWSRRAASELIRAGRDWEEEFAGPTRRRRIPLDDDR